MCAHMEITNEGTVESFGVCGRHCPSFPLSFLEIQKNAERMNSCACFLCPNPDTGAQEFASESLLKGFTKLME